MADEISIFYDKDQLRQIIRSYKAMSDQAVEESKKMGFELAQYALSKIKDAAQTTQEKRIAETGRASKSSKIGEFSFGYAKKAISGGATTEKNLKGTPYQPKGKNASKIKGGWYGNGILAGVEFGSNLYNQFRPRTAQLPGGGNKGYFIYPTLEKEQPKIIKQWEQAFDRILKEFN